jgi:DNA mismatch repair protein MutS
MKTNVEQTSSHTDAANSSEKIDFAAVQHDVVPPAAATTPAMQQYMASKAAHPDCLVFYRMGDFYELFFDDAVKASAILGIALTKRGKHQGEDIAMCGVPVHSADGYLEMLIASGAKVAICEQMEDMETAKKRGYKAVMRREVVRIVTPGTITEESLLDARAANYLCALAKTGGGYALAWLELSTGEFTLSNPTLAMLGAELARLMPREILLSDTLAGELLAQEFWQEWKGRATLQPAVLFDAQKGERKLKQYYQLAALDALGELSRCDMAACGALIEYLEMTQKTALPRLEWPKRMAVSSFMAIDPATRRNLELVNTLGGERKGSLLSVIDKTVTSAGARLLATWLAAPLTEPQTIHARLDTVEYYVSDAQARQTLRDTLAQAPDLERCLSRICLDRGGPRDLLAIQAGLQAAQRIRAQYAVLATPLPLELTAHITQLGNHDALIQMLAGALRPEAGLLARDGHFIRDGYHAALDEFRMLRDESKRLIAALEARYQQETGVNTLKIRYNNVLGYYAEVTAQHQKKITETFIHRQSLANALRYTTTELGELERKIAEATDRALKLELELFAALVGEVKAAADGIAQTARAIAALDVASALAELAAQQRYVRPVVDASQAFAIVGGRHPVVEAELQKQAQGFISNDCDLGDRQRLWLLTGPNMAGKSTFLRQNALIAILAQMGSFVPAASAHIGAVDACFSRVGAADDLARGRSTFMVEMVETALILNQATKRSLVILDEIGRGTATFDGLSIAWAVVEHLHNAIQCRALFATHYHEMTALAATLASLSCRTMKVKEWKGDVIFMHEVAPGAADRSYGIHVAKLAGLPEAVLTRATHVLETLEQTQGQRVASKLAGDLPLFDYVKAPPKKAEPSKAEAMLADIHPDELSPKEALEWLYRLKEV